MAAAAAAADRPADSVRAIPAIRCAVPGSPVSAEPSRVPTRRRRPTQFSGDVGQQAQLNRQAAVDTAAVGNVNTQTPYGQLEYFGTPGQADYMRRETLNPTLAETLARYQATQNLASDQAFGRTWDFNARNGPIDLSSYGYRGRALQRGDLPGAPSNAYEGDQGSRAFEDATFRLGQQRLTPQFENQEQSLRNRLANQGISGESAAGQRALASQRGSRNSAMNELALQSQIAGRHEFGNQFQRQLALRDQERVAQGQQFQQLESGRQSYFQQDLNRRQQMLGELSQLLNIGKPEVPQFQQAVQPGVNPVNHLGNETQRQISSGNNQAGFWSSLLGAGASIGGALIGASDRRLKKGVKKVGGLYEFLYKDEPTNLSEAHRRDGAGSREGAPRVRANRQRPQGD